MCAVLSPTARTCSVDVLHKFVFLCAQARVPPTLQGRVEQYAVEEEEFLDILDTASFVERPGTSTNINM